MTSVEFVEKALIGSPLNDSYRRQGVSWLGGEDFTNPLCRAVWKHRESDRPPRCQPLVDLVEMSEILGRDYELNTNLRGPAELATLQVQAPERPAVADCGRILVEATIRREVAAVGLRLEPLIAGEPEQIIDEVTNALATLEGLHQRWQIRAANGAHVDTERPCDDSPLTVDEVSRASGPWKANVTATCDNMEQQTAERSVIGAAIHNWPPLARGKVLTTVRHSDFTDPRAAATWRAVEYLAERDLAIDEVTTAWQVLRTSGRSGDGLSIQELRATRAAAIFHEVGIEPSRGRA